MEFLWGWQVTLTWSVLFPLAGLVILSRGSGQPEKDAKPIRFTAALGLIALGTFSSAEGFFGFEAALLIVLIRAGNWRRKTLENVSSVLITSIIFWQFISTEIKEITLGIREVWYVLTALGAALWGSPVGMTEFGWSWLSFGGLLICIPLLVLLARSVVKRHLARLAGPIGITSFGFLCLAPIAMSRPYLGNWHVQYGLPAICGAFLIGHHLVKPGRQQVGPGAVCRAGHDSHVIVVRIRSGVQPSRTGLP